MTKQQRANLTLKRLNRKYAKYPQTGLVGWKKPWQLLFCIIMSAQTTDDQVNKVAKTLFKKFKSLEDFANTTITSIGKAIKSTGFYNSKSKYLQNSARMILTEFKSKTPKTINYLIKLPGVARKTANVYQQVMYNKSEGIAVDTHVGRMSQRLELTKEKSAVKIEKDLMKLFPKSKYHRINPVLFWHGRTICLAKKPQCEKCELNDFCPSAFKS
ncbi:endonuclease III domain-containing protein [Patescibacteria group bacterium]